jgi:hypothetical protein
MANFNYTHSQLGATVWSPSENADLMLPNKSTVGQTDTEALRRILGKIGI